MANPTPNALALLNIGAGADILSADHRTNYASVQAEFNKVATLLAGGVSGQVLQAAGAASAQWANIGGLYRKVTAKQVLNTVADTDLLNGEVTVAAGVLGTSGMLRLTAFGDWIQNSGAARDLPRFKLKLGAGATVVLDTSVIGALVEAASAIRGGWRIVCEVMNLGATNAQWANLYLKLAMPSAALAGSAAFAVGEGEYSTAQSVAYAEGGNSAAIDTTAAMAVQLSVVNPSAVATCDTTLKGAVVEVV